MVRAYLNNWIEMRNNGTHTHERIESRLTARLIKYLTKQLYTCRDNKNHNDLFVSTQIQHDLCPMHR